MKIAAIPSLSVVMAVRNGLPYLAKAIESVQAQSHSDFEFVIIDDGSTDGSEALVDQFAAIDGRVVVLHQTNQGLAAALNSGIGLARASIIARMDADDIRGLGHDWKNDGLK